MLCATSMPLATQGQELLIAPVLSIKQDRELAVTPNACLRSSQRSTTATIELRGSRAVLLQCKESLEGRDLTHGTKSAVILSLHYVDNDSPVQMVRRHQYADQINCIPQTGGHKDAASTFESARIVLHSDTPESTLEECRVQFARFGSTSHVIGADPNQCALRIMIRFATNVTSKGHQNRLFFWRAEVRLTHGEAVNNMSCLSHPFSYKVKFDALSNQPAAAIVAVAQTAEQTAVEQPSLCEMVCDGRPGDLLILTGKHLSSGLNCRITFDSGEQILLERSGCGSSNCFTTRLPSHMLAQPARICVLGNGVASNELAFGPAIPAHPMLYQPAPAVPQLSAFIPPTKAALQQETTPKALAQKKRQQARTQRQAKPYGARPAATEPAATEQPPNSSTGAGMLSRNCSWDAEMWSFALSLGDRTDTLSPGSVVLPFSRTASEELLSWGNISIA